MADEVGNLGEGPVESPIPIPPASALVLHFESSRQRRWAVKTALDLVKSLTARKEKVVVADLQRHEGLAELLGVEQGPGIVDVLFRGTSFSVVAKRPEGEHYYFLSIGTNPPPVQVIYSHPQWKKIAARLPEAKAHLVACVPWHEWMEAGPIPGFEACILLNGVGSDMPSPPGARPIAEYVAPPEIRDPALATTIPGTGEPDEATGEEEEAESDMVAGFMATEMDVAEADTYGPHDVEDERSYAEESAELEPESRMDSEVQPASEVEPEPEPEPVAPEPWADASSDKDVESERPMAPGLGRPVGAGRAAAEAPASSTEELWPDSYSPRRRRRSEGPLDWARRRWPLLATAAVLIAALGLWRVLGSGESTSERPVQAAAEAAGQAIEPTESEPETGALPGEGEPQTEAVAEEDTTEDAVPPSTQEDEGRPEPAVSELPPQSPLPFSVVIASFSSLDDALSRQRRWSDRETLFYVAPTVVRGVVYYRVFAGLLRERETAQELAEDLVERGIKESTSAWDVRPTSLAFHFGTYDSRRKAISTVETLEANGVPAYIVAAPAPQGSEAYHVYAGGYQEPEEATPLRQQIEEAGFEAELVERVGMPGQ